MKLKTLFAFLFCLSLVSISFAQQTDANEPSLDRGSIESQFDFIYQKSGNYRAEGRRYEVVRTLNLDKLKANVLDSISASKQHISSLNATISNQESTISSLNSQLTETTSNLNSVTEEKDNISLFGMSLSKAAYNLILWTIIIGLSILLLFFIFRFKRSNYLTQEAKSKLQELETEFEDHRRRALEREQRISRQLQDEINKYKKSK